MSFEDFDIDPRCLSALRAQKIVEPTAIQAEAIPIALEGRDMVAIAQTGTGKTLAFALPALTRLAAGRVAKNMMLVLVPTRELAVQVHSVIEEFGRPLHIRAASVYGGVSLEKQTMALRKGVAVIVATPGRLLDHMGRGNVRFKSLEILVLDEADRMLDMGFLPDIRRILAKLPDERQTIMCSATFPNEIARLAEDMLYEPEQIRVGAIAKPVDTVRQTLYTVDRHGKMGLLATVLREQEVDSALVFLRTKHRTERVAKNLRRSGLKAQAIHGDRTQRQRQQALDGFKSGRYNILVATDVAARGLDIDGVSHVINFDIPSTPDDYIHRIGRTARASAKGDAVTFVCPDEHLALRAIESALGHNLPRKEWEGAVSVLTLYRPAETKAAGGGRRQRQRRFFRRR